MLFSCRRANHRGIEATKGAQRNPIGHWGKGAHAEIAEAAEIAGSAESVPAAMRLRRRKKGGNRGG